MASPDLVIGYHELDTKFFTGHVQHTTIRLDAPGCGRWVKEVKNWYRDLEIGRGSFGTVFLERSEKGECRAVKEIAKDKNSRIKIDYRGELMAMAILAKHDALFVQLFGWYESDDHVHIAMEYISHGHLRNYLEVERSESEVKVITRQLLEGLVVIHQEGFAHRDLRPENIFVVSTSPVLVKIGDFGLAKLARDGTTFRTQAFSAGYSAPEMGIKTSGDSSEYTNAVDIWAIGCIAHEMLTRVLPFPNISELSLYCARPEFPRKPMLLKNISRKGMEIVESMLALPPERRIAAKEALDSEWLRLENKGQETLEIEEDLAGPALPAVSAPSGAEVANGNSLLGDSKEGFRNCVAIAKEPWVHTRISVDGQAEELGVSRYLGAFGNPKPHASIDAGLKRALELVLLEIQKSTDSPQKPMLSDKDAVYMLLNGVVSVDIRDSAGNTPLHIAVNRLNQLYQDNRVVLGLLHALVASGADINAKNSEGKTPLFLAVRHNSPAVTGKLLELGANAEEPSLETPLHAAATLGSDTICQLILRGGANVNARNSYGRTPLHMAALHQRLVVASSLISAGADVGARDNAQLTALYHAVVWRSVPLVKLLLDHGANPDVVDKWGISPRRVAVRANVPGIVAMFDRARVMR